MEMATDTERQYSTNTNTIGRLGAADLRLGRGVERAQAKPQIRKRGTGFRVCQLDDMRQAAAVISWIRCYHVVPAV
jgi:hypothetical protein